jgi:hypothetical protein
MHKDIKSQRGGFLIGALVFVVILAIAIFAVTTLVTNQNRAQVQSANERKAFYAAETGLEYAIGVLRDSSGWRDGVLMDSIADGQFSVTLDDSNTVSSLKDTILVTSTGYKENIQRSIQVYLVPGPDLAYALLAGEKIDFTKGEVTVNGDIHSNGSIKTGEKTTINGTATEAPPVIQVPIIDWASFKNEAIAAGTDSAGAAHYVEGDMVFTLAHGPYYGIWYATGKATIVDNQIKIYGSIIAEGEVDITRNYEWIEATPSNYPAIATQADLILGKNTGTIKGLVYCTNLVCDKNNTEFYGGLIVTGTFTNGLNNTEINYDPQYLTGLVGVSFPWKSDSLTVLRWQN